MPAIPSCVIEPIRDQFHAFLPPSTTAPPLGCHRPRVPERVVVDKLVQVLVFGCADERIADASCSATTLRRRRDAWINAGVMADLHALVVDAYDRMIGLEFGDVAVDGCITKAPCGGEMAGRSPVDRGKQGIKRSTVVDANGIPLGVITAPANRHDAPLLDATLDTLARLGPLPAQSMVHLDRGYDSAVTRETLRCRGLLADISGKDQPAPLAATQRWVVERTNAWTNAYKTLVWCTERRGAVIAFRVAFARVIIIVRRLVRQAWTRSRWETRPRRRP